nr:unnamed protein product [Callosobruchus analis]
MKAELFFEYIANVFHPYLVSKGTKFPIILFVDQHSTHTSYQLSDLCSKLNIILICLYGNSTRILQPADVSTFKPLKSYWKKGERFAPILKTVIENYIKPDIIRHGFRATGLSPWNADVIDYSKCLGKAKTRNNSIIKSPSSTISYCKFQELVGKNLIEQLEAADVMMPQRSEEFLALHKLWKAFHTEDERPIQVDPTQTDIDLNQDTIDYTIDIENIPIILENSLPLDRFNNDSPIIIRVEANGCTTNESVIEEVNELDVAKGSSFLNHNEPQGPLSSKEEDTTVENNVLNQPDTNLSLKDYLVWPESPIRKERQKEERKRKRQEKKEENDKKKKIKKESITQVKKARNRNTSKTRNILSSENEQHVIPLTETHASSSRTEAQPKIKVISNIQVKKAFKK